MRGIIVTSCLASSLLSFEMTPNCLSNAPILCDNQTYFPRLIRDDRPDSLRLVPFLCHPFSTLSCPVDFFFLVLQKLLNITRFNKKNTIPIILFYISH